MIKQKDQTDIQIKHTRNRAMEKTLNEAHLSIDPIDERLEQLCILANAWHNNRSNSIDSPSFKQSLILCAKELTQIVENHPLSTK